MTTPAPPAPSARTYKHLDQTARDAMRQQRVAALEQEHYANVLALEATTDADARKALLDNLGQIGAAIDALDK